MERAWFITTVIGLAVLGGLATSPLQLRKLYVPLPFVTVEAAVKVSAVPASYQARWESLRRAAAKTST